LSGNVLAVANQTLKVGQKPAGMWLLDGSDLARVKRARSLDDLKLAFFDTKLVQGFSMVTCRAWHQWRWWWKAT
jgi:hypothetical protein